MVCSRGSGKKQKGCFYTALGLSVLLFQGCWGRGGGQGDVVGSGDGHEDVVWPDVVAGGLLVVRGVRGDDVVILARVEDVHAGAGELSAAGVAQDGVRRPRGTGTRP